MFTTTDYMNPQNNQEDCICVIANFLGKLLQCLTWFVSKMCFVVFPLLPIWWSEDNAGWNQRIYLFGQRKLLLLNRPICRSSNTLFIVSAMLPEVGRREDFLLKHSVNILHTRSRVSIYLAATLNSFRLLKYLMKSLLEAPSNGSFPVNTSYIACHWITRGICTLGEQFRQPLDP